jgi:hypothetical protein
LDFRSFPASLTIPVANRPVGGSMRESPARMKTRSAVATGS